MSLLLDCDMQLTMSSNHEMNTTKGTSCGDLGHVLLSMVLSWLENKFFGNENFIGKNPMFSTLIFFFRPEIFQFFFQKHSDFPIKISILRVKNV